MVAHAGEAGSLSRPGFDELLAQLRVSGTRRAEVLSGLDAEALEKRIPDDRFGGDVPVWWVVVRGNLDHETHHRGQIATYLRLLRDRGIADDA